MANHQIGTEPAPRLPKGDLYRGDYSPVKLSRNKPQENSWHLSLLVDHKYLRTQVDKFCVVFECYKTVILPFLYTIFLWFLPNSICVLNSINSLVGTGVWSTSWIVKFEVLCDKGGGVVGNDMMYILYIGKISRVFNFCWVLDGRQIANNTEHK